MTQGAGKTGRRAAVAACVALAGCATGPGAAGPSSGEGAGLFRTSSKVGDLSPAPTAGWYVPQQTPRYVKMGLAREALPPRRGWLARLFGPPKTTSTAVIAEGAALPLPSVVQITNVATGASLRVRVEERAPMGEDLVRLNAGAARELGVSRSEPLLVRVRFVEPAIAYRQGAPLTYALGRRAKGATQLATAEKTAPAPAPAVLPAPLTADAPIVTVRLEQPLAGPRILAAAAPTLPTPAPRPPAAVRTAAAPIERPKLLRVQAGAFADPGNARRAVALLSSAGPARMQSVQRADGMTLYRVYVECQGGTQQAEAVRAKVVRAGFADARVVRPS